MQGRRVAESSTIECNDRVWPLAVCRFRGNLDPDDFAEYLAFLHTAHRRRDPWGLLLDATEVRGVSATQRKQMADFLREHEELARQFCVGTAFVLKSPLMRGTLTAVFWFQKQPTAYTIVATEAEALGWLSRQGKERGIVLPSSLPAE